MLGGSSSLNQGSGIFININSSGDLIKAYTFQTASGKAISFIGESSDGGFILGGTNKNSQNNSIYLAKIDTLFGIVWAKSYTDTTSYELLKALTPTSDYGYLLSIQNSDPMGQDMSLMKIDDAGNAVWKQRFLKTGNEFAGPVHESNLNYFTFGSLADSLGLGKAYLMKTDSAGAGSCNSTSFASTSSTISIVIDTTTFLVGSLDSFSAYTLNISGDAVADSLICSGINIVSPLVNTQSLSVHPNPSSGNFTFTSSDVIEHIEITSLTGSVISTSHPRTTKTMVNLSGNAPGIYFYTIQSRGRIERGKLLLQ